MLLADHISGVLDPRGPIASAERLILFDATAIMLAIIVPVIIAALAFAWWFRAGNIKAVRRPDWAYSGRLEFITWSIPALVVLFIGGIGWLSSHDLDPRKPLSSTVAPIEVQVVSLNWKWLFIYPQENIASVNTLVLPVGVPVHFRITSATVMNSFFVPQLGSQIYAMAGMVTQLSLKADRPGIYSGFSAQFSGDGFSDMRFAVHVVTQQEFESWLSKTRIAGLSLDNNAYAKLARESEAVVPYTYRFVTAAMFDHILTTSTSPSVLAQDPRPNDAALARTKN